MWWLEWFQNSQIDVSEKLNEYLTPEDKNTLNRLNTFLRWINWNKDKPENELTFNRSDYYKKEWKKFKKSISSILSIQFDKNTSFDDVVSFKEDKMAYNSRAERILEENGDKLNYKIKSSLYQISKALISEAKKKYEKQNTDWLVNTYNNLNNTINTHINLLNKFDLPTKTVAEKTTKETDSWYTTETKTTQISILDGVINDLQNDRNLANQRLTNAIKTSISKEMNDIDTKYRSGTNQDKVLYKIMDIVNLKSKAWEFVEKDIIDNKINQYLIEFNNDFKENISNIPDYWNLLNRYEWQLRYLENSIHNISDLIWPNINDNLKSIYNSILIALIKKKDQINNSLDSALESINDNFLLTPTMDLSDKYNWYESLNSKFEYYNQNDLIKNVLQKESLWELNGSELNELAYLMWISELEKSFREDTFWSNENIIKFKKWLRYWNLDIWKQDAMVKFLFSTTSSMSTKLNHLKYISDRLPNNESYKQLVQYIKSPQYISDFNNLVDIYAEEVYKDFDNSDKSNYNHVTQISVTPNNEILLSTSLDNKWNPLWLWLMFYDKVDQWWSAINKISVDMRNFEVSENQELYTWFYMKLSGLDHREQKTTDSWQEVISIRVWGYSWRLWVDKFWNINAWENIPVIKPWETTTENIYYDLESQELKIKNNLLLENNFVDLALSTNNQNWNRDQVSLSVQTNWYPTFTTWEIPPPLKFSGETLFWQADYKIQDSFKKKLDSYVPSIKEYLAKYPDKKIQVSWFTNSDQINKILSWPWGSEIKNNEDLSKARADEVKKYLIQILWISEDKIISSWYWETRLVDSKWNLVYDKSKEDKAKSRRVEITMI